jgi:hypothetical protein
VAKEAAKYQLKTAIWGGKTAIWGGKRDLAFFASVFVL